MLRNQKNVERNVKMKYNVNDLLEIAKLLSGTGSMQLPKCIEVNETTLYGFCFEYNISTEFLDDNTYCLNIFARFLELLADGEQIVSFVDYYLNVFINDNIEKLAEEGFSAFLLKEDILRSLNELWSIDGEEFACNSNSVAIKSVKFKEYNKMGEGGFCTVYRSLDPSFVYKVLNIREKSDVGSVHRFKREFEIMNEHNDSGYTIRVYDYNSQDLYYAMERAEISLEEYIERKRLSDEEVDDIVIRCATCMQYLHEKKVLHRDFHPGNILRTKNKEWVVTDFGLAKSISEKYSHMTTSTKQVGRAWFTDPIQLDHLKEGNYQTDMYSLAKTIDYIMNGNKSGAPHKYTPVIYQATASDPKYRYNSIEDMLKDLLSIRERTNYKSPEEKATEILEKYKTNGKINIVELISALDEDAEGTMMWNLILAFDDMVIPFMQIINVSYEIALREIRKVYQVIENSFQNWTDYDSAAYWAEDIIMKRKNINDEINIKAAAIIEYVAKNANRFKIKKISNSLKSDSKIDGHVRAKLSYYEGY